MGYLILLLTFIALLLTLNIVIAGYLTKTSKSKKMNIAYKVSIILAVIIVLTSIIIIWRIGGHINGI